MAYQTGSIYLHNGTWYLKYRTPELKDGTTQRVHKTERLCARNGSAHHRLCETSGEHRSKKSVEAVRDKFMAGINAVNGQSGSHGRDADTPVTTFWETIYLPYCESEWRGTGMKASTVSGYKKIWETHLKAHFEGQTIRGYQSDSARVLLNSLKTKMTRVSLSHVKALASAMFSEAIGRGKRKDNPWGNIVKLPKDCIVAKKTQHYTLEEAEDLISALVDHADCQLLLSLVCFLGLRPSEAIAVRWEDFDADAVHVRRACVNGIVGTPKTEESVASLPLIDQVRIPLELWRQQCASPTSGWVFKKTRKIGEDVPADLHNLINRVIKPHVKGGERCVMCDSIPKKSNVTWKGLYSGRRGAATAIVGLTNGNIAAAQELLRHKSMDTTMKFYKKQTQSALADGLKAVQKALTAGEGK